MKALAIVVNYRTPERTLEAVESLIREIAGLDTRVTVVDNDSRDGSFEKIARDIVARGWEGRVEVVASKKNGGFGYGNNVAIRRTYDAEDPPDYFYLLNPDAIAEPGAVAALLDFLDGHPTVGIAGSRVSDPDGEQHVSAFRFPSPLGDLEAGLRLGLATRALGRWVVAPGCPSRTGPVDWVSGASLMIRRQVLESVGLFDERFFLYFEETDLCLRARRAGWATFYVHESRVRHEGSIATGMKEPGRRVPGYWFASRRYFFMKNYGARTLVAANALFAVGYSLWRVRRRIQRKPDVDPPHLLLDFLRYNLAPEMTEGPGSRPASTP